MQTPQPDSHYLDHIAALVTIIVPAVVTILGALALFVQKILKAVGDMKTQVANQGDRTVNAVKGVQTTVLAVHEAVNGEKIAAVKVAREEGFSEGYQTGQGKAAPSPRP